VIAIVLEVGATLCLKESGGFTRVLPSVGIFAGYGGALFLLTLVIERLPLSITYALWSGIGLIVVCLISFFYYKEPLDAPAVIGVAMVFSGVLCIRLFSSMSVN
jgi:small multidrug resistance pump